MKKIYLLAGALAGTMAVNAQSPLANDNSYEAAQGITNVEQFAAKAAGSVLWSSDFSTATDWTVVDGANHVDGAWAIVTALPAGFSALAASGGPYDFTSVWSSPSGGEFALVNSDAAGSVVNESYLVSSTMTIATDIAAAGGTTMDALSIKWTELYRHYQEKNFVEVSNDNGATWTQYEVNALGVNVNSQTPGMDPNTEEDFLTIPAPAAGWSDMVQVRFFYQGNFDWFWAVDDVSVSTLPDHDVKIESSTWGSVVNHLKYYKLPNEQIQPMLFSANISNNGGTVQTNVKLEANTGTSTETSNVAASLAVAATDSLAIEWTPSADMTYNLSAAIVADSTDDVALNNAFPTMDPIQTGGMLYQRDNGTVSGSGGGESSAGSSDFAFEAGNYFEIANNQTVHSIDVGIDNFDNNVGNEIYAAIYTLESGAFVLQTVSEFHTVSTTELGNVVRIYLEGIDGFELQAGTLYFACVGTTGEFRYQTAGSTSVNGNSLVYYPTMASPNTGTNFYTSSVPVVRMNMEAPVLGINENSANVGLEVYPNPAVNNVNVEFSLDNETAVELSISDLSGKVVYTNNLGNVAAGSHKVNVETAGLSNGVYMYTFAAGNTVVTEKLVIKK